MVSVIRKWPVTSGAAAAMALSGSLLLAHLLIPADFSGAAWVFTDSAMRLVLAIPGLILLGYIIQSNGFKFVFTARGFAKGMLACAAVLLLGLTPFLHFFHVSEMDMGYLPQIPAMVTQQIAAGIFEETLFRGLFMAAMLAKWSGTAKGRLICVLVSGFVFGAGHLSNLFHGEDTRGVLINALGSCMFGLGFAAAWLYSKNLLCCMLAHALNNIAVQLSDGLIAGVSDTPLLRALHIAQPVLLYAVIPLFAIFLSVKAKPYAITKM